MSIVKARAGAPDERRQLLIGCAGLALVVVLLLVCVVVAVNPFADNTYRADFENAGGLRVGDEVRIAGIAVGEVKTVAVSGDHVEVRFEVRDDVHVGRESGADSRLLTAIGGHYLALRPAGDESLGSAAIPRDRTTVPYNLTDVLTDSGDIAAQVNGVTIRQTLEQVDEALSGRPAVVRQIIADVQQVTTTIGDRNMDLDKAVQVSEEYVAALDDGRVKLVNLLRLIGLVGAKAYAVKAEGVETIKGIGGIFAFVGKPINAFTGTIEPPVQKVLSILESLQKQPGQIDDFLRQLRDLAGRIGVSLGVPGGGVGLDYSKTVVDAPGVCIPSPTRTC